MFFAGLVTILFALEFDIFGPPLCKFPLEFPLADLHLFLCRLVVHLLDNSVGHPVHEHLLTLLSRLDFSHAIGLLLLQHRCVQLLGLDIFQSLTLYGI